jgi:hypothetical protein
MKPYTQISNFELPPALLFEGEPGTQGGDPGGGSAGGGKRGGGKRPAKKKNAGGGKKKSKS